VLCDWLPGVLTNWDVYQERSKEGEDFEVKGWAGNAAYDWDMFDAACGIELDYVVRARGGGSRVGLLGCVRLWFLGVSARRARSAPLPSSRAASSPANNPRAASA